MNIGRSSYLGGNVYLMKINDKMQQKIQRYNSLYKKHTHFH